MWCSGRKETLSTEAVNLRQKSRVEERPRFTLARARGLLPPGSSELPGCCSQARPAFPLSLSCPTLLGQVPFRQARPAFPLSLSCPTLLGQIRLGSGRARVSVSNPKPLPNTDPRLHPSLYLTQIPDSTPPSGSVGSNAPHGGPELSPACRAGSCSLLLGLPAVF